jgi:predicted outer membrane repeat protein
MSFFSWLRNRNYSAAIKRPSIHKPARKPATFRPRLEALEGRDVPSTLTVTNTLDDGSTSGSLRVEIAAAQRGDTIQFAIPTTDPGYNLATGTFTITLGYGRDIQISTNLTIQGPGSGLLTISGGGGAVGSRVFEIDGAATAVTLSGLSITGGNGVTSSPSTTANTGWSAGGNHTSGAVTVYDGQGGAIWNGGVLKISDCNLSNNSADLELSGASSYAGGAIYNAGSLTVTNSVLSWNSAGDDSAGYIGSGGAIYNAGTLSVVDSSLTHNAAHHHGSGGAIASVGTLSVSGGTISYNSASYDGGGIFSGAPSGSKTTATVTGTTLSNNSAYDGGAIYNDTTLTLSGCSVGGNTATDAGGGIYDSKNGHLTIQSACNVTGNSAPVGADLDALGPVKISKDSTVGVIGP